MVADLIAFYHLPGKHDGKGIATAVGKVLDRIGITDNNGWWTLDNASNNDTFMKELATNLTARDIPFSATGNRIRCFPHMVNIAVQHTLTAFNEYPPEPDAPDSPSPPPPPGPSSQGANAGDEETPETYEEALANHPIAKCREIVKALRISSARREEFARIASENDLPVLELMRDVDTRWDTVYEMIRRVVEMQPVSPL